MSEDEKPLVTFALFSYNQGRFIKEAVESALFQDYQNLEIILSDDCSVDDTFEIMKEMSEKYSGGHRVVLNRNEKNIGLVAHVNKVLSLASGDLIVFAAGDDVSFRSRVSDIVCAYLGNGRPLLVHSRAVEIDADGVATGREAPDNSLDLNQDLIGASTSYSIYLGASGAIDKRLYIKYGGVEFDGAYEDLIFGFRAILENSVYFVDRALLYYRVGVGLSHYSGDLKTVIGERKKLSHMKFSVVRQRILDYEASGIVNKSVLALLESELVKFDFLSSIYSGRVDRLFLLRGRFFFFCRRFFASFAM